MQLNRALWFVGKALQIIGMFEVLYGLIIGFAEDSMASEMKFAGIGIAIFLVGWLVEKQVTR
jgi:hypothetical protein